MGIETRTLTQNEQMIAQQQAEAIANAGASAIQTSNFISSPRLKEKNNRRTDVRSRSGRLTA
jgi:hypothetical protein